MLFDGISRVASFLLSPVICSSSRFLLKIGVNLSFLLKSHSFTILFELIYIILKKEFGSNAIFISY